MTMQLPRSMRQNRWLSVLWAGGWLVVAGLAGAQSTPVPWNEAVQGDADAAAVLVDAAGGIPETVPLSPGVPVYRLSVIGDTVIEQGLVSGAEPPCHETDGAVYCNTLGKKVFGPSTANIKFADDIALAAEAGHQLDRFVIRVTGDRNQDGAAAGAYTVNFALYKTCPGAGGATAIVGTSKAITVPAEQAGGIHEISHTPLAVVGLPSNLYLGVWFSRLDCGIVVGAPALLGHSADRFDYPSFPCASGLGGYPAASHASFYAEIYVTGACERAFASYKNTNDAGKAFSAGANRYFADDIRLAVRTCRMTAYEVNHKGSGLVRVQLHTSLSNSDPADGGIVPGTRTDCFSSGALSQTCRKEFDPPIPLAENLWAVFRSSASGVGPIRTCQQADPGNTKNLYMIHDGQYWEDSYFNCAYASSGFALTIFCEGQPPIGACCDTILTDDEGEAVCRELPEMNCPFNRWLEGEACEPDPFVPACGLSSCCKPDDTCENLTENECVAVPPLDAPRLWQRDRFCGEGDQRCLYNACLWRVGDCSVARPELGCEDAWCCTDVCDFDSWCCRVAWDDICIRWADEFCQDRPYNDSCYDPDPQRGALLVDSNSHTAIATSGAATDANDPRFCCYDGAPGQMGRGSVWFRFQATHTSARVHTCDTPLSSMDSLISVFRAVDSTTLETACNTLDGIACSDDAPGCGNGLLSDVCVTDLTPGETYFVMLAGKAEDDLGVYYLDIESPCTPTVERPPNDYCHHAETITENVTPFDLAGATFDCPGPPPAIEGCLDTMKNDLWYDWTAPCNGEATIEACARTESAMWAPSLVVYDSCECPPGWPAIQPNGWFLACDNGFWFSHCFLGSLVTIDIERERCYKIRLGGQGGGEPAGNLTITTECPTFCPVGAVGFVNPPDGVVDARQPYPPGDPTVLQGIGTIVVAAPEGALATCFALCETNLNAALHPPYPPGFETNDIEGVAWNGDGTYTLTLKRPITPGEVTTITYTDDDGTATTGSFIAHPANVNGDSRAAPADILALVDALNGVRTPRWGVYGTDIDHSGVVGPPDILRVIDLLNAGWLNTTLPTNPGTCPRVQQLGEGVRRWWSFRSTDAATAVSEHRAQAR